MNKLMRSLIIVISLIFSQLSVAQTANKSDPYERYNRVMFKINDKVDTYVLQPVARGYRKVTPSPVRQAVRNVFDNLRDVVSLGSNILRGDVEKAGTDFVRVAFNSTFGLGGLINVANEAGIPENKNNLGDTFASWGWKNSNYFVYPLAGPSTVRDSIGNTALLAYSSEKAIFSNKPAAYFATALEVVDTREQFLDATDALNQAAVDKYTYTRDVYMALRNAQLGQIVETENIDDLVSPSEEIVGLEDNIQIEKLPENFEIPVGSRVEKAVSENISGDAKSK